jgi:hypothetical protein
MIDSVTLQIGLIEYRLVAFVEALFKAALFFEEEASIGDF